MTNNNFYVIYIKGRDAHYNKMNMCEKAGIELVQIFSHEWENRKDQIKSFLRSKFGKNEHRVYARKCEIRHVDFKTGRDFLNTYHIQGACNFKYGYGLYNNNELLALMTFNKHHRGINELVLSRFVGRDNLTVVGGLSKLCKHALNELGPFSTWVDLRWSTGQSWVNMGWKPVGILKPDYFYYNSETRTIFSKQSRRKSIVHTPKEMTESEHAKIDGLSRIYDCGKLKLTYN